jgi:hypothetical protein
MISPYPDPWTWTNFDFPMQTATLPSSPAEYGSYEASHGVDGEHLFYPKRPQHRRGQAHSYDSLRLLVKTSSRESKIDSATQLSKRMTPLLPFFAPSRSEKQTQARRHRRFRIPSLYIGLAAVVISPWRMFRALGPGAASRQHTLFTGRVYNYLSHHRD